MDFELDRYKGIGLSTKQAKELYDNGKGNTQIDNTAKTKMDIVKENVFTYCFLFPVPLILLHFYL